MIQVPILFRYVRRKIPNLEAFKETALDEEFDKISLSIEEIHKIKVRRKDFRKRIH